MVAWGMIIENGRQPTVHRLRRRPTLEQVLASDTGIFMNAIAVPTYETQTASSNGASSTLQKVISLQSHEEILSTNFVL